MYEHVALDQKGSSWRAAGEVWGWWWACRASVLSKHCKAPHMSASSAFSKQNGQGTLCQKCRVCAGHGSKMCVLLLYLQSQHRGARLRTEPVPSKAFGLSFLPSILTALYWFVNKLPATSGKSFIICTASSSVEYLYSDPVYHEYSALKSQCLETKKPV